MAKIKIRQLPNGASHYRDSDLLCIAQSSGGIATRYISCGNLAGKIVKAGSNISINSNGVISVTGMAPNLAGQLTALSNRVSALEGSPPANRFFVDTSSFNSGKGARNPSTAALNYAKAIIINPPPGSTVGVLFRTYWAQGGGNSTAHYTYNETAVYNINSSGSWVFWKRMSRARR